MWSTAADAWASLSEAWQIAFGLAWEGLQAGSPPVGAVIVDSAARVVASGRSRRFEVAAPAGQLAGTNLAHAEINAMAQLPPGDYFDHVLHTTLEPCLLCTAAATHAHVGTVIYYTSDPIWVGIRRLPELNDHVAGRWPAWEGPIGGPLALWSEVLMAIWQLREKHDGVFVRLARDSASPALPIAARFAADREFEAFKRQPFDQALASVWDQLCPPSS